MRTLRSRGTVRVGRRSGQSPAFTLIELIVAVLILLVITVLTVAVFNTTASSDRIRSSARTLQSALLGARDRALKARQPRGLRLLADPEDSVAGGTFRTTISSVIYVGAVDPWRQGTIKVGRPDNDNDGQADADVITVVRGYGTGWVNLYQQGLLTDGARIQIPATTGRWYTVNTAALATYNGGPEILTLTTAYMGGGNSPFPYGTTYNYDPGADNQPGKAGVNDDGFGGTDDAREAAWPRTTYNPSLATSTPSDDLIATDLHFYYDPSFPNSQENGDYILELAPAVLPGQEPIRLSSGIVLDLARSRIPNAWFNQSIGTAAPAANTDGAGNPNSWGAWRIVWPNPANASQNIYRQYSPYMDIMFSPRGTVTGSLAARGLLHLYLMELEDLINNRAILDPQAGDRLLITIFPQTGNVAPFPIDVTDAVNNSNGNAGADSLPDDMYRYAKIGGVAGK